MKGSQSVTLLWAVGLAAGVSHSAMGSDLKAYISGSSTGSVVADFYWPFENSFLSDLQTMATRQRASAYEINGILTGTTPAYDPAEYFPILPDHMTRVARSTALIFGETTGDLAPGSGDAVDRYIQFDLTSNGFTVQPLATFGMDAKNEWTLHMVVSPDSDPEDDREWETLFDIGDPDHLNGSNPEPIRVTVELDRHASGTEFRVVTQAQGYPERIATTTVADTNVQVTEGRRWYQVIVQYYEDHSHSNIEKIRIYVNTINSSTLLVDTAQDAFNSNEWRSAVPSTARVGLDIEDVNPFHGAIHHFAIWKKLIDTDYDVSDELEELADTFAATYASPDPRPQLAIDWDAEPRFFMWDRPLNDEPLASGDRNIRNWTDPIWDIPYVYPLVRLYATSPDNSSAEYTPADLLVGSTTHTWSAESATPTGIGRHIANWIEYLSMGIEEYGRDTDATKSLWDEEACAVLLQNWGVPMKNFNGSSTDFYTDWGSARGLAQNWRDARAEWRDGTGSLTQTITTNPQFSEILSPFYREGMSQNAFRSKDMFIALKDEIDDLSRNLPMPTRLHFDTERASNINEAWKRSGGTYFEGWWDRSIDPLQDSRADDVAHWVPPTVPGGAATLAALAATADFLNATNYDRFQRANDDAVRAMTRFARDQYDHAFGVALLVPALQELNPTIRMSEYKSIFAGTPGTAAEVLQGKVRWASSNMQPTWFDFSAPNLYPPSNANLDVHSSFYSDTLFKAWGDALGIATRLVTDNMTDNGAHDATIAEVQKDARIVFVEKSKQILNATYLAGGGWEGAPTSPWIPYPGNDEIFNVFSISGLFDVNGDTVFNDTVNSPLEWQDIAKICAFAYRRGVREFLMWGNLGSDDGEDHNADHETIADELALVFLTIDHIRTRPTDMTTTGAVPGDDDYGLPDGDVDWDDLYYFQAMHTAGDMEGDFSGPDGHPDGIIDSTDDPNDFGAQWFIDLYL